MEYILNEAEGVDLKNDRMALHEAAEKAKVEPSSTTLMEIYLPPFITGLKVLCVINKPTAAALAYSLDCR